MAITSIQQVIEIAPVSDTSRANEVQKTEEAASRQEERPAPIEENKGRNIDVSA